MNGTPIPTFVHHTLWAYDIGSLDLQRNKHLIITQVLNRGGAQAVRWLRQLYGDREIAAVVQSPARGCWFPQVLNFWALLYGLTLSPDAMRRAVIGLPFLTRSS